MIALATGFSTDMTAYLEVGGRQLSLGQLGPEHCIVRDPISIKPIAAEILIIIDGRESRLPVYLPNGIKPNEHRVAYQNLTDQGANALSGPHQLTSSSES